MMQRSICKAVLFVNSCLLFPAGAFADAPTEDQILELEQQINQQEMADKKRKAEALKFREEQARLEEERRKLEQERIELEAARAAEAQKQEQLEEERKSRIEQFITAADNAKKEKDYKLAESNYDKALSMDPQNEQALAGRKYMQELMKRCTDVIGVWGWDGTQQTMTFEADGTVVHRAAFNTVVKNQWECADPEKFRFIMKSAAGQIDYYLSEDGTKLKGYDPWGNISFAKRSRQP